MTYLIVNIILLILPLGYWLGRGRIPLRAWGILMMLGLAFDLTEVHLIRVYTFPERPLLLGLPIGEYLFIIGLPLRAIAFYEICSGFEMKLRKN